MHKKCPLGFASNTTYKCCDDTCILYDNGCLIKKALMAYIYNNEPIKQRYPTEEELSNFWQTYQCQIMSINDSSNLPL